MSAAADDLLTTSHAARELHLSESGVRKAANAGQLLTKRTSNGTRLFRRQDVDDYRAAREKRSAESRSGDQSR